MKNTGAQDFYSTPGTNTSLKYFEINFLFSILSIFGCLPFGLISLYYATNALDAQASGNIALVLEFYRKMKRYMWISYGIGAVLSLLFLIFVLLIPFKMFERQDDGPIVYEAPTEESFDDAEQMTPSP